MSLGGIIITKKEISCFNAADFFLVWLKYSPIF